jgi:hypothetical protein
MCNDLRGTTPEIVPPHVGGGLAVERLLELEVGVNVVVVVVVVVAVKE